MDWYLVIPISGVNEPDSLQGAAQVFIVETTDSDLAAQVAHDQGFSRCLVLVAEFHEAPIPKEEPNGGGSISG